MDEVVELSAPEFILEVLPYAEYVNVIFVDQHHTQRFSYGFKNMEGRMFMTDVTENRYPDAERFHPLNETVWTSSMLIKPTGYVRETAYDLAAKEQHLSEYRDVDVSPNWEGVPEFGDWEYFGKFGR